MVYVIVGAGALVVGCAIGAYRAANEFARAAVAAEHAGEGPPVRADREMRVASFREPETIVAPSLRTDRTPERGITSGSP